MTEVASGDEAIGDGQHRSFTIATPFIWVGKMLRAYLRAVFTPLTDEEKDQAITWN